MTRSSASHRLTRILALSFASGLLTAAHAADDRVASLPQPIALAASWDRSLTREVHEAIAADLRARGGRFAIGPSLELARDPRRGRIERTFGDDAYLVGEMGVAAVSGLQGEVNRPRLGPGRVLAAVEGLAGPALASHDAGPAPVSPRELRETYLAPFERVVARADPAAIVVSRNEIDGVPSHANRWLLRDVVRGEWKYAGKLLSAPAGVDDLHKVYGLAASAADAEALARTAGIDADALDGERALGLGSVPWPAVGASGADRALALRAAHRSIVLLKNDGVLPLAAGARGQRIVVVGSAAETSAIGAALRTRGVPEVEAISDVAAFRPLATPTIVILAGERPATSVEIATSANAVIGAWSLGSGAGAALADVLLGVVNPGGKLPVTMARNAGQLPLFHDAKPSARRGYLFDTSDPLHPFGWGMSYTTFELGAPRLSAATIAADGTVTVSVDVRNTGSRAGDETVQLYVRDKVSALTRPVKMLRGFERVTLAPGESRTIALPLEVRGLAMWDERMQRVVEPGEFEVMTGAHSAQLKSVTLTVTGGTAK